MLIYNAAITFNVSENIKGVVNGYRGVNNGERI